MRVYNASKKRKILVVGNQPAVLISLRTMLSVRAFHVIATDEPKVAIRLAQSMRAEIALALIDVCTLSMEPRELADDLRLERPGLKVLFFSSLVDGEVIRLGVVDPDCGVLRREGVVKAIEDALRRSRAPESRPRTMTAGAAFHYSMV